MTYRPRQALGYLPLLLALLVSFALALRQLLRTARWDRGPGMGEATVMEFHLMRPQWLWALVPALLLAALLWRQRDRLGSWNQVISAELLPFLVSPEGQARGPNLTALLSCWPGFLPRWPPAAPAGRKFPSRCTRSRTRWCSCWT